MKNDICCTLHLNNDGRLLIISALKSKIALYNEFIEIDSKDGLVDIAESWQRKIDLANTLIDFLSE